MRLLLQNVIRVSIFEKLRIVNNILLETFNKATVELNLLNIDKHPEQCMEEAIPYQMPVQLRELFIILLIYNCTGNGAKDLLDNNKKYLLEYYLHSCFPYDFSFNKYLYSINQLLISKNSTLERIGLPSIDNSYYYEEGEIDNNNMIDSIYDDFYN